MIRPSPNPTRYFGNILAPVIIVAVNNAAAAWWWGLMWPVVINVFFGILCYYFLSEVLLPHPRPHTSSAPSPLHRRETA